MNMQIEEIEEIWTFNSSLLNVDPIEFEYTNLRQIA